MSDSIESNEMMEGEIEDIGDMAGALAQVVAMRRAVRVKRAECIE